MTFVPASSRRRCSANAKPFRCRPFPGSSAGGGKGARRRNRHVNVSYPYFIVCLFSAGIHTNEGDASYFWGQAVLIAWALVAVAFAAFWHRRLAGRAGGGDRAWLCRPARHRPNCSAFSQGYNAQWLAGLLRQRTDPSQSATAIGQIGKLKLSARIVIRLEPKNGSPPPLYLREASYRLYARSRKDKSGIPASAERFRRAFRTSRATSPPGSAAARQNQHRRWSTSPVTWMAARGTQASRKDCCRCRPAAAGWKICRSFSLKTNNAGAVLAAGLGLVIFDAHYGPGATFDSPPDASTNHLDLAVPTNEVPALDQVIAEMKISGATEEQKLLAVQQFFAAKFSYSTWLGPDKVARTNETALSRFLLQSRSGHCEYFATATVLLLRELGIPARYAVGYAVHETSGRGYVVRERDAHAWCLVWNAPSKSGRTSTPRPPPGSRRKTNARRPCNGFRISGRGSDFKSQNSAGDRAICANTSSGR